MKHSLWKLLNTSLLLILTTTIVSAQKIDTDKLLNEDKKQEASDSSTVKVDAPVSTTSDQIKEEEAPKQTAEYLPQLTDTKTKKKWSFTYGGELTNYFISDSHQFFGKQGKSRLETSLRLNGSCSYKYFTAGCSGFNHKINQNSQTDAVQTLDADEQPIQEVFQTELVYPQERGEVQLTFSPRYGKGGGQSLFQAPVSVEYGITKNWQVEVEWDVQSRR